MDQQIPVRLSNKHRNMRKLYNQIKLIPRRALSAVDALTINPKSTAAKVMKVAVNTDINGQCNNKFDQ